MVKRKSRTITIIFLIVISLFFIFIIMERPYNIITGKAFMNYDSNLTKEKLYNLNITENNLNYIEINNLKIYEKKLIINYTFNNSIIIGDAVSIEISIVNKSGFEIKKIIDDFFVNKDSQIQREVIFEIQDELTKDFFIYFILSENREERLKIEVYTF